MVLVMLKQYLFYHKGEGNVYIDNQKNKMYHIENEYSELFEGNSKYYLSIQSE